MLEKRIDWRISQNQEFRLMNIDEHNRLLLTELSKSREFIQQNWKDPIGDQFVAWVLQSEENLKKIERKREIIRLKCEKIKILCQDARTENEDATQKILTK